MLLQKSTDTFTYKSRLQHSPHHPFDDMVAIPVSMCVDVHLILCALSIMWVHDCSPIVCLSPADCHVCLSVFLLLGTEPSQSTFNDNSILVDSRLVSL